METGEWSGRGTEERFLWRCFPKGYLGQTITIPSLPFLFSVITVLPMLFFSILLSFHSALRFWAPTNEYYHGSKIQRDHSEVEILKIALFLN